MYLLSKTKEALFAARDVSSLAVLRVALGAIILWEVKMYFDFNRVKWYYIDPVFHFSYGWFEWVKPLPGDGMYWYFYLLAFLSVLVMLGLFYRMAIVLQFFSFTYLFLLDSTNYLNHFYLICLVNFLMIFIPAHRKYSIDALLWKNLRSGWVPAWTIMLIQFQLGIVYCYGALAKMNYDWLFRAQPMQGWLGARLDYPLIGRFFDESWIAFFMSWSGMLLDLFAPFLLMSRKGRPFMYAAVLLFHFMNDRLFRIGVFPWFMIVASTMFFPADWPKRLVRTIRLRQNRHSEIIFGSALVGLILALYFQRRFEVLPFVITGWAGAVLAWTFIETFGRKAVTLESGAELLAPIFSFQPRTAALLCIWIISQMIIPLRHYAIPGDASWTEEGHRFAWRMMLRQKIGWVKFYVYDPQTDSKFEIEHDLNSRQYHKMSTRPEMILQYAKYLKRNLVNRDIDRRGMQKDAIPRYQIRVDAYASLNYNGIYQLLIDPDVDLSRQTYCDFRHNPWILQFGSRTPFQPPADTLVWDDADMERNE